jgi:hypothetical protein
MFTVLMGVHVTIRMLAMLIGGCVTIRMLAILMGGYMPVRMLAMLIGSNGIKKPMLMGSFATVMIWITMMKLFLLLRFLTMLSIG